MLLEFLKRAKLGFFEKTRKLGVCLRIRFRNKTLPLLATDLRRRRGLRLERLRVRVAHP